MVRPVSFTGYSRTTAAQPGAANPHLPGARARGSSPLLPVLGGLIYGPLIARFASEARGHGVPEVMLRRGERAAASAASRRDQGAGLGTLHRVGRLGRPGRADRPDRLGSRVDHRAAAAPAGVAPAAAGRLRRRRRNLRNLQRTDRRRLLRARADPARLRNRIVRRRRALLRDRQRDRPRSLRVAAVPDAAGVSPAIARGVRSLRGLGLAAALVGTRSCACSTESRISADRIWHGPAWLRPAVGGVLLGLLLLVLPAALRRRLSGARACGRRRLHVWFLSAAGRQAGRDQPDHRHRRLRRRLRTRRCSWAPCSAPPTATWPGAWGPTSPASPAPTGSSAWARYSPAAGRAPITRSSSSSNSPATTTSILPLMVAIVIATAVAALFGHDSIYTLKLRRRGIELRRKNTPLMQRLTVADAMRPIPDSHTRQRSSRRCSTGSQADATRPCRSSQTTGHMRESSHCETIRRPPPTERTPPRANSALPWAPSTQTNGLDTALERAIALRRRRPAGALTPTATSRAGSHTETSSRRISVCTNSSTPRRTTAPDTAAPSSTTHGAGAARLSDDLHVLGRVSGAIHHDDLLGLRSGSATI